MRGPRLPYSAQGFQLGVSGLLDAFGQGCHDGVRAGGMLCHHPGGGGDEGGLAGQAVTSGFRR